MKGHLNARVEMPWRVNGNSLNTSKCKMLVVFSRKTSMNPVSLSTSSLQEPLPRGPWLLVVISVDKLVDLAIGKQGTV